MLSRLFRTLYHLKPRQLLYFFLRRVWVDGPLFRLRPQALGSHAVRAVPRLDIPVEFNFLNLGASFSLSSLQWAPEGYPRLWGYHLHYFDYLGDAQRSGMEKDALIECWIRDNVAGSRPGWEPYPTSLRIVNWCQYFDQRAEHVPDHWYDSLRAQVKWLRSNIEWHIQANHLFENLKALVIGGSFPSLGSSAPWLPRVQGWLMRELREQFLPDGCHYERSPAYHCVMISGVLDLLEWQQRYPMACSSGMLQQLSVTASRGLSWLSSILMPGGAFPLFNDSAYDAAPPPADLFLRARQLGLNWDAAPSGLTAVMWPHSGIWGARSDDDALLLKCAPIGPDYQPGHTHCDLLSFELYARGSPLIVDTGVCEYQPGAMRQWLRSTRAHNTVAIDDVEQSEIWGEFRVARRASIIHAGLSTIENGWLLDCGFEGFHAMSGGLRHQRLMQIEHADGQITGVLVSDTISGKARGDSIQSVSRLHLHPDVRAECIAGGSIKLFRAELEIGQVDLLGPGEVTVENSVYCPEFGLALPNQVVAIRHVGPPPVKFGYSLRIR